MSSNLKRKLHTSIRNSLPQCNIKVILRSTNHLSSLFCFKDVIPKELRPQLVYKFWCSSCNATYYGKIERHLNVRSGEHIGLASFTGNRVACKPSTISDHLLLHEHNNSSFNDFSILFCENNAFKLSLREPILIKRDPPELNRNISLYVSLYKAAYITQLMYNPQENVDNCFIFYNLVLFQYSIKALVSV